MRRDFTGTRMEEPMGDVMLPEPFEIELTGNGELVVVGRGKRVCVPTQRDASLLISFFSGTLKNEAPGSPLLVRVMWLLSRKT